MSAQLPAPAPRRRPASTAPRPRVSREITALVECCLELPGLVPALSGLTPSAGLEVALKALTSRTIGSHGDVVCEALSALAWTLLHAELLEHESAFAGATIAGKPGRALDLRTDAGQLAALAQIGLELPDLAPATLHPHRRRVAVKLLDPLRARVRVARWIQSGGLLADLRELHAGISDPRPVPEAAAAAVGVGLDGERIAAAVIHFESQKHLGLVWQECNRLEGQLPGRTPSDMFAYGWDGLRMSLRKYDPEMNAFSTYACQRIKGTIRDGVRAEGHIPKRLTTYQRKVARVEEELTKELGRAPKLAEIAQGVGVELAQLDIIPRLQQNASLDEMTDPGSERSNEPSCLIDHLDPADLAVAQLRKEAIAAAMDEQLSEEERIAVQLLFLDGLSPAEAKLRTGDTSRQLRQRALRGLNKLRPALVEWAETAQ